MRLHVETQGQGPDLVLLHGWGLHGGVFAPVCDALARHYTLHLIDLPGHGHSRCGGQDYCLAAQAERVLASVPSGATWLGWSLGGSIALQAAIQGAGMAALVLVGASACFCRRADWSAAIPPQELAQVADALEQDWRMTLQRFVAVQSRGSEQGREELRRLRESLFTRGEPDLAALRAGLAILREADQRAQLGRVSAPTRLIHGARDTLVPLAAARWLTDRLADAKLHVIDGAGHAPFLSHPRQFVAALREGHDD